MEEVVLLDKAGKPCGTAPKAFVHGATTPLHAACSILLKNKDNQVLLQKRAATHPFAPGVWAGSACGHPRPGEKLETAIQRILQRELGIGDGLKKLHLVLPDFRYTCTYQGVQDNEVCPTFVARYDGKITHDPSEVERTAWVDLEFLLELSRRKGNLAYWTKLQLDLLQGALREL